MASPAVIDTTVPVERADSAGAEQRILDATLRCIARWGLAKTTLDDLAREARCSRATVYRLFPGGKTALLEAVGQREVARLIGALADTVANSADLGELLVAAISTAARFVASHDALSYLLRHEPETLGPFVAFDRVEPVLDLAIDVLAPRAAWFVDDRTAAEIIGWAARMVISYTFTPNDQMDLTDADDVHRLVSTYLLPGVAAPTAADDRSLTTPTHAQGA